MSELINNREFRKKKIREIILALHQGKTVDEVKKQFTEIIRDISPSELSAVEQELIDEGLGVEEVRRLCDVHLAAFKEGLESGTKPELTPGHPVHTFKLENRAIESLIAEIREILNDFLQKPEQHIHKLQEKVNLLMDIEKHYSRKENVLFPFLEKYNITGPSKVMWSHDDEIRALLKEIRRYTAAFKVEDKEIIARKLEEAFEKILAMIAKEENVLFGTALQVLTEDEWFKILQDSAEIGYCLVEPQNLWKPYNLNVTAQAESTGSVLSEKGYLRFPTGVLTPQEIYSIFNHLPVDITFVDKDGLVKFFSSNKDRIFVRSKSIIGRRVENCHPPASVDRVESLVNELASGKKDAESFWLHVGDKYVFITYIAVRNEEREFIGVLEVTQDIKPLRELSGEKRIAD